MTKMKFVQVTDLHLLGDAYSKLHNIPIYDVLKKIISEIKVIENDIEFILVTGDISEDGSEQSYAIARELFSIINKPIFWIAGNHDRLEFTKSFNNEVIDSLKPHNLNGIKLILLNTIVPASDGKNRSRGVLTPKELLFLNSELEENMANPVIIAMHHPPIKLGTWKDERMLENAEDFFKLINRYNNSKLILYGHQHQAYKATIGNTTFYSPPAASFQFDKNNKWAFAALPPGYGIISVINSNNFECQDRYIEFELAPVYRSLK